MPHLEYGDMRKDAHARVHMQMHTNNGQDSPHLGHVILHCLNHYPVLRIWVGYLGRKHKQMTKTVD